ncbi:MAG: hypothetical protein ABJC79_15065 [Acidimicrobiia bacterium]
MTDATEPEVLYDVDGHVATITQDFQEGLLSFMERRAPDFEGR